jgi:hypothetical protein
MTLDVSTQSAVSWDVFFRIHRRELNAFAIRNWPLPKDRSGPESTLGWRRLFDVFPVATDVIVFDTEGIDVRFNQTGLATAIRYDLSQPKTSLVRDHGIIPLRDFETHAAEIQTALALDDETLTGVKKLTFTAITGYPNLLHIVQYEARTNVSQYIQDFLTLLSTSHLAPLFETGFDFNAKYKLRPDPILSEPQLLTINDVIGCFFRGDRSQMIKKAQQDVASIKPIQQVPPEIGRLIHAAKRLYVFGLFEYEFFTIAHHYAYLAVEAALYHRWSAEQSKPFLLTHGSEKLTVHDSGRGSIVYICENKGWDKVNLRLNGKRFPFTNAALVRQLKGTAVITEWQYNHLQYWLRQRNSHSHREFGPLEMPDPGVIKDAVEIINTLFDGVAR